MKFVLSMFIVVAFSFHCLGEIGLKLHDQNVGSQLRINSDFEIGSKPSPLILSTSVPVSIQSLLVSFNQIEKQRISDRLFLTSVRERKVRYPLYVYTLGGMLGYVLGAGLVNLYHDDPVGYNIHVSAILGAIIGTGYGLIHNTIERSIYNQRNRG